MLQQIKTYLNGLGVGVRISFLIGSLSNDDGDVNKNGKKNEN